LYFYFKIEQGELADSRSINVLIEEIFIVDPGNQENVDIEPLPEQDVNTIETSQEIFDTKAAQS
jgi:hypothetical protein